METCKVIYCNRIDIHGRKYCKKHYLQILRHNRITDGEVRKPKNKTGKYINCKICKKEFYIAKCHFDTKHCCSRVCYYKSKIGHTPWHAGKGNPKIAGNKNYMWKGDKIGYYGIHAWLKKHYGKADKCESKICNKKSIKFEWALKKGKKYERKRKNFIKLCKSCHVKYDWNIEWKENLSKSHKGKTPWNKGLTHNIK